MCDQLSSIGVEFDFARLTNIFIDGLRYGAAHPFPFVPSWKPQQFQAPPIPWAGPNVFQLLGAEIVRDLTDCTGKDHHPRGPLEELWAKARPWALGQMRYPGSVLQLAAGTIKRHPGLFMRIDPETNEDTSEPLINTNETVHSSVRVRLACLGLGMDDQRPWECAPLLKDHHGRQLWRLERGSGYSDGVAAGIRSFRPRELDLPKNEYPDNQLYQMQDGDGQYRWVFSQQQKASREGDEMIPPVTVLPEEPLVGYWERLLLYLNMGKTDIWRSAEMNPPLGLAASN